MFFNETRMTLVKAMIRKEWQKCEKKKIYIWMSLLF